ncbi:MAG: hypothetical protein AB7E80_17350 [Hyphomicrobiaceae bacterium]
MGHGEAAGDKGIVLLRSIRRESRRLRSDERGAVAIVLAITISVVLFMAAIAVDDSRWTSEWMQDQYALDAALLAASDTLGLPEEEAQARARAEAYYLANRPDGSALDLVELKLNSEEGVVEGSTRFDWKATLLRAFGYEQMSLGSKSRVVRGGTAEIALVLDNSGSMAGSYIEDLKTAASDLVNVVFAGAETADQTSVSVIPFAGSVNIGPQYRGSGWIDSEGAAPLDAENAVDERSRFQLFDDLGVAWAGCVEVRAEPYATSDTTPDAETPATLFTPMFAPDEPDDSNDAGKSYANSYLVDDGGTCPKQECTCPERRSNGACKSSPGWVLTPISAAEAQAATCKYKGEQVGYASASPDNCRRARPSGAGPNAYCTTRPLLPLTSEKTDVLAAISAMGANGMTNIAEGVGWGWRTLSPSLPFAEGRSYHDAENKKILIVMTDGENTYTATSDHNRSRYGALGYAKPYRTPDAGRLGNSYSNSGFLSVMNARTRAVCSNAKAQGIKVYTVAFRLESNPTTLSLLRECASETRDAYVASDGQALIDVFRNIGREISSLRISN